MNRRDKGRQGEEISAEYLKNNKYKILDKNYYTRFGEIDIIGYDSKRKETVFIEVKTRGSTKFGYPEEAVDQQKMHKIMKTAWIYIKEKSVKNYRFDCLAIEMDYDTRIAKIRHYKNIGLNF